MAAEKLDYMDYFRAVAILFIVAGHTLCWGSGMVFQFNMLMFAGGTYFFVFIAGFLFQYLSYKFDVKTYYKKKLLNVLCPYFTLLLPVAVLYAWQNKDPWVLQQSSAIYRFINVLMGGYIVNGPVWFMGMISIVFLCSPGILYLKKEKPKLYLTLFLASAVLALTVPRESSLNGVYWGVVIADTALYKILFFDLLFYFKAFCHFLFFYLLGMEVCSAIEKYVFWIRENIKWIFQMLLFLYVFQVAVQLFVFKNFTNIQLISKFIEIFVLLSGCILLEKKIQSVKILDKTLKFLATYSFGIFFVHAYLINYAHNRTWYNFHGQTDTALQVSSNTFHSFIVSAGLFVFVLAGSVLFLWACKFVLNKLGVKKTRMFIGV